MRCENSATKGTERPHAEMPDRAASSIGSVAEGLLAQYLPVSWSDAEGALPHHDH